MNEPLYTLPQLHALSDNVGAKWEDLQQKIDTLLDVEESTSRETEIKDLRDKQDVLQHIGHCINRAITVWFTTIPGASFRKLKGPEPLSKDEIDTINQFAMYVSAENITR